MCPKVKHVNCYCESSKDNNPYRWVSLSRNYKAIKKSPEIPANLEKLRTECNYLSSNGVYVQEQTIYNMVVKSFY